MDMEFRRSGSWRRRSATRDSVPALPGIVDKRELSKSLRSERAASTALTSVLSGRPARGIVNSLIRHGEALGSPNPADYPVAYDATKRLLALAAKRGFEDLAVQWAGQGAPLFESCQPPC